MVTTHFSGVGTAEIACAMVADSLKVRARIFSSADIDKTCQKVLLQHDGLTAPQHVFTDVVQSIPKETDQQLRDLLRSMRSPFEKQVGRPQHSQVLKQATIS